MLEAMVMNGRHDDSPGPGTMVASYQRPGETDKITGYYGTLPAADFINGPALSTVIGMPSTYGDDVELWFKLHIDGKIVYVPKRPVSNKIGFNRVYLAGAAYGIDGPGINYGTPVNQIKTITIAGNVFKLRLLSGFTNNPTVELNLAAGGDNVPESVGSEWNRLIYNLCSDASHVAVREGPLYGPGYTWAQLCSAVGGNIGTFNYTRSPLVFQTTYHGPGCRGSLASGAIYASLTLSTVDAPAGVALCWRPVLEYVGKE